MKSQAYQLVVRAERRPTPTTRSNYSHGIVRRLTAEQMLDALNQVLGVPLAFDGLPRRHAPRRSGRAGVRPRERKPCQ